MADDFKYHIDHHGSLVRPPALLAARAAGLSGEALAATEEDAVETAAHLQRTQLAHLGVSRAQQAGPRAQLARLQIEADRTWAHIDAALSAAEAGRQFSSQHPEMESLAAARARANIERGYGPLLRSLQLGPDQV